MANPILLKHSTVAGAVPTAVALAVRELALNTADGRLFTKTGAGTVVEFARQAERGNWNQSRTLESVTGQLAWRNYSNGHTIFDASSSVSPSGTTVNNSNPEVPWSATYPTLMGWNGANTYGARVDSARIADTLQGNAASAFSSASHAHGDVYVGRSETKSFGLIQLSPVQGVASCTTLQFIEHLQMVGMFNYAHSFARCTLDYSGNNDISDTGFGAFELAGCLIETWGNNDNKMIRVTRPVTGTGGAQELIYNDQGAGYSPGWRQVWNSSTLTNLNQLSNGPGFITAGGDAGRARGLTRSDAAVDSHNVQSHWNGSHWELKGYYNTDYFAGVRVDYATTADACKGNSATATTATNLAGFTNSNASNPIAGADSQVTNGIGYANGIALLGQDDGALYTQAHNPLWVHQIYGDYRTGQMAVRGKNNNAWQTWRTVLDSTNVGSYALPIGGGTLTVPEYAYNNTSTAGLTLANAGATKASKINLTSDGGVSISKFINGLGMVDQAHFGDASGNSSVVYGFSVGTWLKVGAAVGQTSSDIYMVDGNEGTRRIHCNSDRLGFLNQADGWGAWCDDVGNWSATGTVTGSNLSGTNTGDQTNISGSAGSATFQRSDVSGNSCHNVFANTPVGQTSTRECNGWGDAPNPGLWVIHSLRHTNPENIWGTQIAYGWEDNANSIYQRNAQAGNWSGWTRVDVSGANITELANNAGFITSAGTSAACSGNANTATTSTSLSGGTIDSYGNGTVHFQHGQNFKVGIPSAYNTTGSGDCYLYQWTSEPGATWTGGGIARNISNTSGAFPRVNTGLSGQMLHFHENGSIELITEDAGGTRTGISIASTTGILSTKGITVGNVANASTTVLDWYEEGSWTPVISGSSVAGTCTYAYAEAKYTRIGNKVEVVFRVSWSAHGGTGNLVVSGFPFAQGGLTNYIAPLCAYNLGVLVTNPMLSIGLTTSGTVYGNSASGGLVAVAVTSEGIVTGSFSYTV